MQSGFEGSDAAVGGGGEHFERLVRPVAMAKQFEVLCGEFGNAAGKSATTFRELIGDGVELVGEEFEKLTIKRNRAGSPLGAEVFFDFEVGDPEGPAAEVATRPVFRALLPHDHVDGLTDIHGGVHIPHQGADEINQLHLVAGQFLDKVIKVLRIVGHASQCSFSLPFEEGGLVEIERNQSVGHHDPIFLGRGEPAQGG